MMTKSKDFSQNSNEPSEIEKMKIIDFIKHNPDDPKVEKVINLMNKKK